ncbi:hypothetical protein [Streptomyces yaizuensis]|uniref:Uncharacterized protein n=1 Tax=Streptomyces yaizuensis TaxID=2989713 RepID=A0ABQ5NTE3_9ACTN|nr:hypothetical protein [Streptomyces sp. YSPA8]GLF93617.1 hypothetical protein SYYSPA8_04990 [Streptomyces sp. YSPA8]
MTAQQDAGGPRHGGTGNLNGTVVSRARLAPDLEDALRAALLREASALPTGPPPVHQVIARGRRIRDRRWFRRRSFLVVAAVTCVALGVWARPVPEQVGTGASPMTASPGADALDTWELSPEVTERMGVEPHVAVPIGRGATVTLAAGDAPRYTLDEGSGEQLSCARCVAANSLDFGVASPSGLLSGAFRLARQPDRVVVRFQGEERRVGVVRLKGTYPGWGFIHLFLELPPVAARVEVVAYGKSGRVLASLAGTAGAAGMERAVGRDLRQRV